MSGRTKAYITGAAALLAVLTVVLCALGGLFNFKKSSTPKATESVLPTVSSTPITVTVKPSTPTATVAAASSAPEVRTYSITVTAGNGGRVSPSGLVTANEGESVTFTAIADDGYELRELKVDGQSIGAQYTYTFMDLRTSHSLYAVFQKKAEPSPSPEASPEATPEQTPETESTSSDLILVGPTDGN